MARFEPFAGTRYAPSLDPADVTAPPYDVLDDDDVDALLARHPRNIVAVDVPRGDYDGAAARLAAWRSDATMVTDPGAVFYGYAMTAPDGSVTHGVLGALEVSEPGTEILPHEHTTPKARSDRLQLQRACRGNLSPIWGLSLASGLGRLSEPPADATRWSDDEGVGHALWVIDEPEQVAQITKVVAEAPVVIADGHHRYEVSRAYRAEQTGPGPWDTVMTFVVELAPDQLTVHAIHRLLADVEGDLLAVLSAGGFDVGDPVAEPADVVDQLVARGALALVLPGGLLRWLTPRPGAFDGLPDLDSARLDAALGDLPVTKTYQHGVDLVRRQVESGAASFGVLLRPVTVDVIRAMADAGERMPPKSTFFWPKLRTGPVLRLYP